MERPIYKALASLIDARGNCQKSGNTEWLAAHTENSEQIVKDFMPSGSGWDCGTRLNLYSSTPEKLVFYGDFHHMDEHGGYDGWTAHSIIVTPSLQHDINIRITGRDRNQIKDYLHEMFSFALMQRVDQVVSERGPKGFVYALIKDDPTGQQQLLRDGHFSPTGRP